MLGLLLCIIAGVGPKPVALAEDQHELIKIGMVLPLTGARASIGEVAQQGALRALEDLVGSRRTAPSAIKLVFEDSQGDPAKGVAAYKKLVLDGIKFVVTQNSNVSLAISPLVDKDKVIQLAITTTSERYSKPVAFLLMRTMGLFLLSKR